MISMSALFIVFGVFALIGTHLFVMHRWLREMPIPRLAPAPVPASRTVTCAEHALA